jgi:hypothetical protein
MIRALGYSVNDFDATSPGRLCRGRERWIEPFEVEEAPEAMVRTVVTGAVFTDDSAADALRGIPHAGVDVAAVLNALFPRKQLLAFTEDGHPADIPEEAEGVELYTGHRAGGRSEALMVRWFKMASGLREFRALLGDDPNEQRILGFALLDGDIEVDEPLFEKFFQLVGMSCLDSPPARFQPAVLPELLEIAKAVVLLHRDKHGPAIGVYSREPLSMDARLASLCDKNGALLVKFAIPPMLARWDRALAELRTEWLATREDEFPVPPAPEPSSWEPRRRDRRRRKRKSGDAESAEATEEAMSDDDFAALEALAAAAEAAAEE